MDAHLDKHKRLADDLRIAGSIIHALYLRLKAERETREAIIDAAQSGAGPEVLEAIASDPVPAIDELGKDATVRALVDSFSKSPAGRSSNILEIGR